MGPRTSLALVVAATAVMGGCDGGDTVARTQIMLVVDADPEVRTRAERLHVWVQGSHEAEQGDPTEHAFGEADPLAWPTRVAVVPRDGDPSRTFEAVVTAEDDDGPFVVARVLSGFVQGEVRALPLMLEGACVDATCGEGETCVAGACVDATVDPDDLDPYDPDDDDEDPPECEPDVSCGLCDLGRSACDPDTDQVVCNDVDLPGVEAASVECDSTAEGSTFVFLDPDADSDEMPDGSRARPFRAVDDALAAAEDRGAAAIVIGGAPTFHDPLQVVEGVSILGGYTAAPEFLPDVTRRPRWRVGSEHYDSVVNRLVGVRAVDIEMATVLRHLAITTSSVADRHDGKDGASNIALRATDAPGLRLEDVVVEAGAAGAGVDGSDGAQPTEAMDAGAASGRNPGFAPPACPITCEVDPDAQVEGQGSHACGVGGDGYATDPLWADALAGNPGTSDGDVSGGEGGSSWYDTSVCGISASTATEGQPGENGQDGAPGGSGHPGTAGSFFDGTAVWVPDGGGDGEPGEPGTWGGGGGAGGAGFADCINEPYYGGHGAGGGGPGCGGASGEGGGGGGVSVGLLALRSGGLTLVGGSVHAGDGGHGGAGGAGAAGGSGGSGGDEAVVEALCAEMNEEVYDGCHRMGGIGGDGGDGGHGGHGAGGAGGDSVAVQCLDGSVTWTDTPLTAGEQGSGGDAVESDLSGAPGEAAASRGCD